MPADGVAPIVLWLKLLFAFFANRKFAGATVIDLLRANIFVHVIELELETAFLANPDLREIECHRDLDLVLVKTLAIDVVFVGDTLDGCLETEEPGRTLRCIGQLDLIDDQGCRFRGNLVAPVSVDAGLPSFALFVEICSDRPGVVLKAIERDAIIVHVAEVGGRPSSANVYEVDRAEWTDFV